MSVVRELFVGRLIDIKNLFFLLDALALVVNRYPKVILSFAMPVIPGKVVNVRLSGRIVPGISLFFPDSQEASDFVQG